MAHISVICPHCLTRFQLDPSLRGKHLVCPSAQCRAVFEVREEPPATLPAASASPIRRPASTLPPSPVSQVSGSVGDLVPILSAEAVEDQKMHSPEARAVVSPPTPAEKSGEAELDYSALRLPEAAGAAAARLATPADARAWEAKPPPLRGREAAEALGQGRMALAPAKALPGAEAAPADVAEADDWFPGEVLDQAESVAGGVRSGVRELGPGAWEAPPVRGSAKVAAEQFGLAGIDGAATRPDGPAAPALPAAEAPRRADTAAAKKARRRSRWLIVTMLFVLAGGLALATWLALGRRSANEAELFKVAERTYKDHQFADAMVLFQNLHRDFPDSPNRARYSFLAELSGIRESVYFPHSGPEGFDKKLKQVGDFLGYYKGDPLLSAHETDVWNTLHKLGKELAAEAEEKKERELFVLAGKTLEEAERFAATPQNKELLRQTRDRLSEIDKKIVAQEQRRALVEQVQELLGQPSSQAVQKARDLVRQAGRDADPQFADLLQQLVKRHIGQVTYIPASLSVSTKISYVEQGPSLWGSAPMGKGVPIPGLDGRTIFALAHGVLYALDPRNGQVRWARRVGIDNHLLPLRMPARSFAPELALVLSTDDKTLSALDADTGEMAWQHVLEDKCLGQPVLVGRRVFLATESGRMEEVDVGSGMLQGYFQVGEPLPVGGTLEEGTSRVYFPAESYSTYVLDVEKRTCDRILYSSHPPGSLRFPPVVVPGSGLMILNQADRVDAVKLRIYSLPIGKPDQASLSPELSIRGWPWFAPFQDGVRLVVATDAGALGYFGIRHKGNNSDPYLFPWFKDEVILGGVALVRDGKEVPTPAQVVHADAENVWALANGRLHRLQSSFNPAKGPQLTRRWPEPLYLGNPLNAPQVAQDQTGKTVLFLVTQDPRTSICLASAVDAREGRIYWQRQLGIVCRGQPVAVGDKIIVSDPGGWYVYDANSSPKSASKSAWHEGGKRISAFASDNPGWDGLAIRPTSTFVLAGDGSMACLLSFAAPASDSSVRLMVYRPDGAEGAGRAPAEKVYPLPATLAGTAALLTDFVVVPLANGVLERLPLAEGVPVHGPNWRVSGAEDNARGHVVALGGTDFLVTDGSRGLTHLSWAEPKTWEKKAHTLLPSRLVAPPAVVSSGTGPPAGTGQENKVKGIVVAGADHTLTLLEKNSLTPVRHWTMPGPITAGPFARGAGIGCVIGGNRLVWLDPNRKDPVLDYSFRADLAGPPVLADGMLIAVNKAGQFLAFDPGTGRPIGPGYSLPWNVPPAASPIPFGPDRLFAPLSDGTVVLLANKLLR